MELSTPQESVGRTLVQRGLKNAGKLALRGASSAFLAAQKLATPAPREDTPVDKTEAQREQKLQEWQELVNSEQQRPAAERVKDYFYGPYEQFRDFRHPRSSEPTNRDLPWRCHKVLEAAYQAASQYDIRKFSTRNFLPEDFMEGTVSQGDTRFTLTMLVDPTGILHKGPYNDIGFRLPEQMLAMTQEKQERAMSIFDTTTCPELYDTTPVETATQPLAVEIIQAWALNHMLGLDFESTGSKYDDRQHRSLSHVRCSFEATFLESQLTVEDLGIRSGLFDSKEEAFDCINGSFPTSNLEKRDLCIEDLTRSFLENSASWTS